MTGLIRGAGLVIIAVALAGCGSNAAGSAGAAGSPGPASSSAAPQTAATVSPAAQPADVSRACQQPGKYLTAVRTAKHAGYDRVVFQFSGGRPAVTAERVTAVYADPKGTKIPLPGHSFLHVVFRWASGFCPQPAHRTWTGPNVLTPCYPQLLAVAAAATRGLPELRPRPVRPGAVSHLHADRPGPDSDRRQPRRVQVISAESARGHQTA